MPTFAAPTLLTVNDRQGRGSTQSALVAPQRKPRSKPLTKSTILGVGGCVPDRVLTNADLEGFLDTSDEWIRTRTGILERRVLAPGQGTSDLATVAARRALEQAELDADEVELVIVATATPDHVIPSTACLVQERIGAKRAAGFDLNAACSGFINALMVADRLVASRAYRNALVIGADAMTTIVDPTNREICPLFGDGAGAVVIGGAGGGGEILDHVVGIDGAGARLIQVPAGGSRRPASAESVAGREHFLTMEGREVFRFAVERFTALVPEILARNGFTIDDLALVVPHQANFRILDAAARKLGIGMERVAVDLQKHGNTAAASVPLALAAAVHEKRIRAGDLVCLVAFGAGLSWGVSLLRWG